MTLFIPDYFAYDDCRGIQEIYITQYVQKAVQVLDLSVHNETHNTWNTQDVYVTRLAPGLTLK